VFAGFIVKSNGLYKSLNRNSAHRSELVENCCCF